jgi:hypothetical protein
MRDQNLGGLEEICSPCLPVWLWTKSHCKLVRPGLAAAQTCREPGVSPGSLGFNRFSGPDGSPTPFWGERLPHFPLFPFGGPFPLLFFGPA